MLTLDVRPRGHDGASVFVERPDLDRAGTNLARVLNQRGHVQWIFPRKTEGERALVQSRDVGLVRPQPLHFRGEDHAAVNLGHHQGLDAHRVPSQDEVARSSIPERERVHAVKAPNPRSVIGRRRRASCGRLSMKRQNDLAVHLALKAVRGARGAQVKVVVDLAVDHGDRAVLTDDGLLATVEVENGQARVGQSDALVGPDAFTVRPAMALQPVDAVEHGLIGPTQHAANAAHEQNIPAGRLSSLVRRFGGGQ